MGKRWLNSFLQARTWTQAAAVPMIAAAEPIQSRF